MLWLATSSSPGLLSESVNPFMTDKCPLCLGDNCNAAHDSSVCPMAAEWQILSMTTRADFCLAFWWRGLHATTTLLTLAWTFCPCVFNVSGETAGPRQGQLSRRTAATIVRMFASSCVRRPAAPRRVTGNVCSVWIWEKLYWNGTS